MTEELKEESKKEESRVDLFLSKVEEKVLTDCANGKHAASVIFPTDFTVEEVSDVIRGVRNFKFYRKCRYHYDIGEPNNASVEVESRLNDIYLVIHWE